MSHLKYDELKAAVKRGKQVVIKDRLVSTLAELGTDEAAHKQTGDLARDENDQLTHKAMELTIKQGGSVMIGGEVFSSVDDLPSEADLAKGDAKREQAAAAGIDAQIAALHAQKARLGGGGTVQAKAKDK